MSSTAKCLCPNGPTLFHNGAGGDSTCMECGIVISENALVSEVSFGETSGGAAMAHGTLVAEGSTHARTGGRRGGEESSEQALYNGRIRIAQVATAMSIPDTIRESALRFYKLAVMARFTKGRKSRLVVAACLYAACQHSQFGYMLIDFSDLLQINVFVLGATYLKLIKVLHMPRPYAIDPAHYIARFAALLEFGDETPKVAHDAARLVKRFRADWMNTGRRPAGICGACLLLAARMNNFRRSVQEIVQVVKIAEQTVLKRLDEFKDTGSAVLTVTQFRDDAYWQPEAVEAPPIIKDQEKKKARVLNRKRKRGEMDVDDDEEDEDDAEGDVETAATSPSVVREPSTAPSLPSPKDPETPATINFKVGIFRDVGLDERDIQPTDDPGPSSRPTPPRKPLFLLEDDDDMVDKDDGPDDANSMFHPDPAREMVIDPALLAEGGEGSITGLPDDKDDEAGIAEAVEAVLQGPEGEEVTAEVEEQVHRRRREVEEDKLDDLDEDELDAFLLTPEEIALKTRVWVELNRDYLEKLAAKGLDEEEGVSSKKPPKVKKPKQKPRDSTTARGATPAEAVGHLLKKPKFSRKINYDAVKNLFKSPSSVSSTRFNGFGNDGDGYEYEDEAEKDHDEQGGLSTIDPDPEPSRQDDYASGYSATGDGDDGGYAQDDYYDDGGYQEEV